MEMKRKSILVIAAIAFCIMAGRIFLADYPIASTKAAEKKQTVSVAINKPVYIMKKGRTVKLKATLNRAAKKKGVEWKSSKPRVASVSRNGKVTAKRNGKTTIFPKKASVKKLFFKSNNGKVTTVDKRGVIRAVSAGMAKITATAADCCFRLTAR